MNTPPPRLAPAGPVLRAEIARRRLRTRQRLETQLAISRLLAEAPNFDEVAPEILEIVGQGLELPLGAIWCVDQSRDMLCCNWIWHDPALDAEAFAAASHKSYLPSNTGLPGRVWASGGPVWIDDIRQAPDLPGSEAAAALGMGAAFAVPIRGGALFFGVITFFNKRPGRPDQELLTLASTLGAQIGEFIKRRRVETALRASEERYRSLFDHNPDAVFSLDLDGSFRSANRASEALSGYPAEQLLGRAFVELIVPEDRERTLRGFSQVVAGASKEIEIAITNRAGQRRELHVTGVPMIVGGRVVGVYGLAKDVTARKQAEEALQKSVEASGTLLSSLQLADVLTRILDLSRRLIAADAYALWRRHPTLPKWEAVRAAGLSESYRQAAAHAMSGALPTITEPRVVPDVEQEPELANRLDGYRREGIRALLIMPLRIRGDYQGTLVFYFFEPHHFSDLELRVATTLANLAAAAITSAELYEEQARLRVQAETAEGEQAFLAEASAILNSSLDYSATLEAVAHLAVPRLAEWCGVYIVGDEGTIRDVAIAHQDPAKAELARELQRRYPPDPARSGGLMQALETREPVVVPRVDDSMLQALAVDAEHLRLLRAVGVRSYLLMPLVAGGRTLGVLSFGTEDSGRAYGPQHLPLAEQLAQRVAVAVENARLFHEAEEALRVREMFLSVASHELRTPLTALQGHAELLLRRARREGGMGERDRRALEVIQAQSQRLGRLIELLMDVARLQSGRLSLHRVPVDLAAVVRRLVEEVAPTLPRHRLELVGAEQRLLVEGDELRLEQVFLNLLDNAAKYSPMGGPIGVRLQREGDHVTLSVSDQGIGIPAEHLPLLFSRFYRAGNVEGHRIAGMGMGLYVIKEIVTLHAGEVTVTSVEGQGSTFTVRLPLVARSAL